MIAELRAAPLPKPLTKIAVHLYFNFYFENKIERWELWESKNAFEKIKSNQSEVEKLNFGHIYKNLKMPLDGVGGGPSFGVKVWSNDEAKKIYETTINLSENYLYRNHYRAWPGPNSNTYIANILKGCEIDLCLPATAIGKDYVGVLPKISYQKNKFQLNAFTAGWNITKNSFWELHLAGLTIGYEKNNKEWKLPFGKGTFPYTFEERFPL